MLHILIDSVDINEVGSAIGDVEKLNYTLEQDSEVFRDEFE